VESARRPYGLDSLTDVALRVFAERGFDGASMDDVARAAGITKAAIYHHIGSKDALLDRGLTRALEALFAVLDEEPARDGPPLGRLRYIVRRVAELAVRLLPELTVLVRIRGNSEVERAALNRRRSFDRTVAKIARAAQEEGTLVPDIEAHLLVRLVFGLCNSTVEWYKPGGKFGVNTIADAVEHLIFDGAATR